MTNIKIGMKSTKKQADIVTYYSVETYAVFVNIDKSILGTNSFLEKFGYSFIRFDLFELEKKFSDLFSLPKKFQSEIQLLLDDSNLSISKEFYQAVTNNGLFGHELLIDQEVFFLKHNTDFDQEVINNTVNSGDSMKVTGELQRFVADFIQQFRLFKNGNIACPIQFQINKDNRKVTSKLSGRNGKTYGLTKYNLSQNEIKVLADSFNTGFKTNTLTELAVSNFNLSYEIFDPKTRYVTLMTCLESLFNQGRDQITHTVSRHLALIISNSENEFQVNYYRIKKLYRLRSAIVHGNSTKENLSTATDELQRKVRQAINYCLRLNDNKKQLFDKLNSMGFGKNDETKLMMKRRATANTQYKKLGRK